MMSTFVHFHLLSSFLHSSVINTDRLLLLLAPSFSRSYERPLAFNIMPARMRLHLRRLRDYFTSVSILSLYPTHVCVCACMFVELSFVYVCQRRTSKSVWREKNREEKKKFRSSATAKTPSAFKKLGDWCVMCVCVYVLCLLSSSSSSSKTERHWMKWRKERREN